MTQWNLYPALNHLLLPHHCQALYEHQAPSPSMNLQTSGLRVESRTSGTLPLHLCTCTLLVWILIKFQISLYRLCHENEQGVPI